MFFENRFFSVTVLTVQLKLNILKAVVLGFLQVTKLMGCIWIIASLSNNMPLTVLIVKSLVLKNLGVTVKSDITCFKIAKTNESWQYRSRNNQPYLHYKWCNYRLQKGLRTILMKELSSGRGFNVNSEFFCLWNKIKKAGSKKIFAKTYDTVPDCHTIDTNRRRKTPIFP